MARDINKKANRNLIRVLKMAVGAFAIVASLWIGGSAGSSSCSGTSGSGTSCSSGSCSSGSCSDVSCNTQSCQLSCGDLSCGPSCGDLSCGSCSSCRNSCGPSCGPTDGKTEKSTVTVNGTVFNIVIGKGVRYIRFDLCGQKDKTKISKGYAVKHGVFFVDISELVPVGENGNLLQIWDVSIHDGISEGNCQVDVWSGTVYKGDVLFAITGMSVEDKYVSVEGAKKRETILRFAANATPDRGELRSCSIVMNDRMHSFSASEIKSDANGYYVDIASLMDGINSTESETVTVSMHLILYTMQREIDGYRIVYTEASSQCSFNAAIMVE